MKSSSGASRSIFCRQGCHRQPAHETDAPLPCPLRQSKIQYESRDGKETQKKKRERRKIWRRGKREEACLLFLLLSGSAFYSTRWEERKRSFVYKEDPPKSTSHKARSDQISSKSSKISKLIWITGQAMKIKKKREGEKKTKAIKKLGVGTICLGEKN